MFAISTMYGLSPARSAALRNVCSCMRGEQAQMTTPVSACSRTAAISLCWPTSEHMY